MRTIKLIVFLCMILTLNSSVTGQNENSVFNYKPEFPGRDSLNFYISVENLTFFKNNEYFSRLTDGLTLPGYILRPSIVFFPDSKIKMQLGVSHLYFLGEEGYGSFKPVFSFEYIVDSSFRMIIGSLYGNARHNLLEPLFQTDRIYTNYEENGVQFLFNNSWLESDIWVNWENFIVQDDPEQEIISGGISSKIKINTGTQNWQIQIPVQGLVMHHGGQIDNSAKPIQTLLNAAVGLHLEKKYNGRFKGIGLEGNFLSFNDVSPEKRLPYISGYGYFGGISATSFIGRFYAGYWQAENYITSKGEPLYQSFTTRDSFYLADIRRMVLLKYDFVKKISKSADFLFRVEGYYDLDENRLDYSFTLNFLFGEAYQVWKRKRSPL